MKRKSASPRKNTHVVRHSAGLALGALLLALSIALYTVVQPMSGVLEVFWPNRTTQITQETVEATDRAAAELAERIEAESAVLLQNRDGALPLSAEVTRVNVFGWASTAWLGGGSGSGGVAAVDVDLLSALADYGIATNSALTDMYVDFQDGREYVRTLNSLPEQSYRLYEPDIADTSCYSEALLAQAKQFSDTALVVLGRAAGESNDLAQQQYKRVEKGGEIVTDTARTYLDLSREEERLLAYVGANFETVIVILNTANVMALGPIETIPGIDACLLAGYTGQCAASALPGLLWGEYTPSGRTADTWAYDFRTAASYANAGQNGVGVYTGAEGLYPADGTTNGNLEEPQPYPQVSFVDYAEGIYIGYKWYETADAEGCWDGLTNEYGSGYNAVVQYPFGYGLSYTEFAWTVLEAPGDAVLTSDGTVSFRVQVTNTGETAGQDVVQLYYSAPYIQNGIEKPALELAAFAKTGLLQPGESEIVTLCLSVADMASYDCYDANQNGFAGYELDAGPYTFTLRHDAHTVDGAEGASVSCILPESVQYPCDPATGSAVTNKFTGAAALDGVSVDGSDSGQGIVYLTRADFAGTFPQAAGSRPMTQAAAAQNLYTAAMAEDWADVGAEPVTTGAKNGLAVQRDGRLTELGRLLGADYLAPEWEPLLDQLTREEMSELVLHGYSHTAAVKRIGKETAADLDGPAQIGGFAGGNPGTGFPSSSTLAQSWNCALAREQGRRIGQQAAQRGIDGWYAPAVNMHRSPFDGRNYEYYSEDSLLSAELCGNTVAGSLEAGTYCYVKHLICNDQESGIYRDGVYTWMTEQALREIYLEPFRILVEKYGATGLMTSYNRLGAVWAGGSYALLTGVLRQEWGFAGTVITDYSDHHAYMNGDQMLRAGGDLWMDGMFPGSMVYETSSNRYQQALRRASKNILYTYLNARVRNESYVAASGDAAMLRPATVYGMANWRKVCLALAAAGAGLLLCCLYGLRQDRKQRHPPHGGGSYHEAAGDSCQEGNTLQRIAPRRNMRG